MTERMKRFFEVAVKNDSLDALHPEKQEGKQIVVNPYFLKKEYTFPLPDAYQ